MMRNGFVLTCLLSFADALSGKIHVMRIRYKTSEACRTEWFIRSALLLSICVASRLIMKHHRDVYKVELILYNLWLVDTKLKISLDLILNNAYNFKNRSARR